MGIRWINARLSPLERRCEGLWQVRGVFFSPLSAMTLLFLEKPDEKNGFSDSPALFMGVVKGFVAAEASFMNNTG